MGLAAVFVVFGLFFKWHTVEMSMIGDAVICVGLELQFELPVIQSESSPRGDRSFFTPLILG